MAFEMPPPTIQYEQQTHEYWGLFCGTRSAVESIGRQYMKSPSDADKLAKQLAASGECFNTQNVIYRGYTVEYGGFFTGEIGTFQVIGISDGPVGKAKFWVFIPAEGRTI